MNSNNPFAQAFAELHTQHNAFEQSIKDHRDRFHKFLCANDQTALKNVLPVNSLDMNPRLHISLYDIAVEMAPWEISLRYETEGVFFSARDEDDESYFILPFDYIEDPEAWERKTVKAIEHYQSLIEDTYYTAVPAQAENPNVRVVMGPISRRDNTIAAFVRRNNSVGTDMVRKSNGLKGDPRSHELVMNYFVASLDNGDIVEHRLLQ